ncbi:MAG: hypothetical protein ACLUKN_12985 [Bacilli bacterium]
MASQRFGWFDGALRTINTETSFKAQTPKDAIPKNNIGYIHTPPSYVLRYRAGIFPNAT